MQTEMRCQVDQRIQREQIESAAHQVGNPRLGHTAERGRTSLDHSRMFLSIARRRMALMRVW